MKPHFVDPVPKNGTRPIAVRCAYVQVARAGVKNSRLRPIDVAAHIHAVERDRTIIQWRQATRTNSEYIQVLSGIRASITTRNCEFGSMASAGK